MGGEYERAYRDASTDPEGFWGKAAEKVHWYRKYDTVLNRDNPPFFRWFEGGSSTHVTMRSITMWRTGKKTTLP